MDSNINLEYENYFFGRAVKVSQCDSTVIIGILDCSGSMSSAWPHLITEWNIIVEKCLDKVHTIIFNHEAKEIKEKFLQQCHCSGGTNIYEGFKLANEKLNELKKMGKTEITMIFISDGEDSSIKENLKHLKRTNDLHINFICVGVGSSFPTFISMNLREIYHSGLSTIPAVFLVNEYKTDFQTHLTVISNNYLQQLEKVSLNDGVKVFPWSETVVNEIYETSSFISNVEELKINNESVFLKAPKNLTKEELEEMFKNWTQELQLISLKKNVKEEAEQSVKLMEYLIKIYESRTFVVDEKKMTVLQRLELRERKSGTTFLQNLLSECRKLRDGALLKDLSASEAAKRLAIGTTEGKFHLKAMKMRGLDSKDFQEFKEEFLKKFSQTKLNETTSQDPSFILLTTQKEVFSDETIPQVLNICSQFDIVEILPMVGHTLYVKRTNGSMINPFLIEVVSIPKINKVCDTVSLVTQGNEMEISIGNSEEEKFNAVIPLFDSKDNDMKPLLRSRLYHLLMTFNVMRNVDTFFNTAYYGLLANTFVRLLKYDDNEWKNNMINLVSETTEIIYGGHKLFESSVEMLFNKPRDALVTEHKTENHKCEDVSKMILNLLILKKRGKVSDEKCAEIIKYIIIEHIGRIIKEDDDLFIIYEGSDKLNSESFKPNSDHNKFDCNKITEDKTAGLIKENNNSIVTDINSDNFFSKTQSEINIDSDKIIKTEYKNKSIEELQEKIIESKEYMDFESVPELKQHLQLVFSDFISNYQFGSESKNVKLNKKYFIKNSRINLPFFHNMYHYFCPDIELDEKIFWIGVHHGLRYNSSHFRSVNDIDWDYEKVRDIIRKDCIEKETKTGRDQMYSKFESTIVNEYKRNIEDKLLLIKGGFWGTQIYKTKADYSVKKAHTTVVFFGPFQSGKSSCVGKVMESLDLLDKNEFDKLKTLYNKVYNTSNYIPYEWVGCKSTIEKCYGRSMKMNTFCINTTNKFVTIMDAPGHAKYIKASLQSCALVKHFCLFVEADERKLKSNFTYLDTIIVYAHANKCNALNIIVTKVDLLKENSINEFEALVGKYITKICENNNITLNTKILSISVKLSYNIDKFISLLDSLESKPEIEMKPKVLVYNTFNDWHNGEIITGKTLGGVIQVGQSFVAKPSNKTGRVHEIQANYNEIKSVNPGMNIGIYLAASAISLGIEPGTVLEFDNDINKDKAYVESLQLRLKYTGKNSLPIMSVIVLNYKFYQETFQLVSVIDENGIENSDDKLELINGSEYAVKVVPVSNSEFIHEVIKDGSLFVIRGKNINIIGTGTILAINYKNKA